MGQTGTTLGTTARQNLAAVAGGHSLAEAVLLGTLTLLGLIGTEHCMTPPFLRLSGGDGRLPRLLDSGNSEKIAAAVNFSTVVAQLYATTRREHYTDRRGACQ